MPFLDKLSQEWIEPGDPSYNKGEDWRLTASLRYHWKRKNIQLVVPAGFEYDQASVPGIVLPIIVNDTGRISKPAVPHDFLYAIYKDLALKTSCHEVITLGYNWRKKDVDLLFRDAMIDNGVPKWRAYTAWMGVKANVIARMKWHKHV